MRNNTVNTERWLLEQLLRLLVCPHFAHELDAVLQFQVHRVLLVLRQMLYLTSPLRYVLSQSIELVEVRIDLSVVPLSTYHRLADFLELL